MTMWGFSSSSRKEHDVSSTATERTTEDQKQLSPSKRSRRRIGRRRQSSRGARNDNMKEVNIKKRSGPLNFSRATGKQLQQSPLQSGNDEKALRSSRVVNQKEWNSLQENAGNPGIKMDATDGQGIEILLDYSSAQSSDCHQRNPPKSPNKGHHHSRRSMSNHKGRRGAPPELHRLEQALVTPHTDSVGNSMGVLLSLETEMASKRIKVYRAQFSMLFPIPTNHSADPLTSSREQIRHRIPLGGRLWVETMSYSAVVQTLQNACPVDEMTSVRAELKKTQAELDALEDDKEDLEQRWLSLNKQQQLRSSASVFAGGQQLGKQHLASCVTDGVDWDIHRLLSSNRKMDAQERADLELKRGCSITVNLENPRSEESFLNKCCGLKQAVPKKFKRRFAAVTVDSVNCRAGGAGSTIRHLALLPKGSSFFVSRDNGKSYSWGQLPPRLLQRMKSQGLDPVKHCGDLIYLSTGPNGYYFAEFQSGECWWGCAGEDKEFYEILQKWEVYRVVFGSSVTHTAIDSNSCKREMISNTWIILGRDGRAAWKNLPSRLHQTLEGRLANSAAPAEVALGAGDSYYVRFLDGTVDYCLPAQVASVCEGIQKRGGTITDMALNPDVSHEFLVRHTGN